MVKFTVTKTNMTYLSNFIKDKEFANKYVNEDKTLKNEAIDKIFIYVERALGKGNSMPLPLGTSFTADFQYSKAKEYINSILSNIKYNSESWEDFVKSIDNVIELLDDSITKNPYTLWPDVGKQKANLLSNISFYIWNELSQNDAKLYVDDLPQIKSSNELSEEKGFNKGKEESANIISKGKIAFNHLQGQNENLKEKLNDAQILRNEVDEVKADIKKIVAKNQSDILNDIALMYSANPSLKQHIGDVRKELKANTELKLSDNQINYIIAKALSENDRYLKTVAANPDLFDRDMSQDTIQKENEQFQSKLRQQNLRYILPKFIERRDKLVENTLNPELLKGAFAI